MRFGYAIIYVENVSESVAFFEKAFGITTRFIHESGYAELETGATALAVASHTLASQNIKSEYIKVDASNIPLGMEIAFVTEHVEAAHSKALRAGAEEVAPPALKPWGQLVSYVRTPEGILVELCSPINT